MHSRLRVARAASRCRRLRRRRGGASDRMRRRDEPSDGVPDPPMPRAIPVGLPPLQGAAARHDGAAFRWRCCGCCIGYRHAFRQPSAAPSARCCTSWPRTGAASPRATSSCACPSSMRDRARDLVKQHFRWLGRSIIERGLLWYAPRERIQRLIEVEGDVHLAERIDAPVMWLVPHFMALEVAAAAVQLFQTRRGATIYQAQKQPRIRRRGAQGAAALRRFGIVHAARQRQAVDPRHSPAGTGVLQPARHGLRHQGRAPSCPSSAFLPQRCWRLRAWRACWA